MADVMLVEQLIRMTLTRNGTMIYYQHFNPTAVTYSRHASDRLVLPANMSTFQEASLGDINSTNLGTHLAMISDRAITVAVNTTTKQVVADVLVMRGTNVSHLYFKNTDADNTATIEFAVTDQNVTS